MMWYVLFLSVSFILCRILKAMDGYRYMYSTMYSNLYHERTFVGNVSETGAYVWLPIRFWFNNA